MKIDLTPTAQVPRSTHKHLQTIVAVQLEQLRASDPDAARLLTLYIRSLRAENAHLRVKARGRTTL